MIRRGVGTCAAATLATLLASPATAGEPIVLDEVTVTGTREEQPKAETAASVQSVGGITLRDLKPAHPTEALGRVSGVHISTTNGEGHMAAIRQPITTSPVYLYLEDGVPTRSTGFFNHNALYEVNVPQSGGIEVNKGPGSALQGSDAIGGVINVLTRAPSIEQETEASLEYGAHGFMRGLASFSDSWGDNAIRTDLNLTHTDGWREKTGYDRQSATLRWDTFLKNGGFLKTVLSASNINQETAGSSRLYIDDYKNNPTENYTPISYRKVQAVRLSSAYENESENTLLSLTPYLRWNSMDMLPNWSLSYDPVRYTTGHMSAGMMGKYRMDFAPYRTRVVVGGDLDYSPGSREEDKISRTKVGNVYTDYAFDETVYDYDVTFMSASPYVHVETSPVEKLRLSGGLRIDAMRYEYDNNLSIDLTSSKHKRLGDNTVNFLHASPKFGATYAFMPNLNGFATYKQAFRAPSESKLFRSGKNIDSMHLDAVKVDNYEIGVRGKPNSALSYEVSAYYMVKKDDILTYTDASNDRVNMNAGETLHRGVEAQIGYIFNPQWNLESAMSYAMHTYEDWVTDENTDYSGNEMMSAPRWIGNFSLGYSPSFLPDATLQLEWVSMGDYWMDEANTHRYTGHNLFNIRAGYDVTENVRIFGRLMNLTDERYATSAKYGSNGHEFAPGLPMSAFIGVEAAF
ncbi:MAG: TonB-dependent receptor [Rhodospirillales bacterium]|nr:TonB-dependent receptor [Rhodospirillales bacterium]MBT4039804.1 TonB-dependent receptor [Rhodospirillales bacterium]MBT4627474.1 TonB-dependent receptor [Rhodospirillales bacterium]MBT5350809.1 TonB-dependent receptor [Rhodospirillales bacterium]MBT5519749.1 TonB-dependent receptor [Rhodospirillales bacterium]